MKQSISVNVPKLACYSGVTENGKNVAKLVVKWCGEVSLMDATPFAQVTLQKRKCDHQDYKAGVVVGVKAVKDV